MKRRDDNDEFSESILTSDPPSRRARRRTPTHGHRHHSEPNLTAGHHHSPSVSLSRRRPRESSSIVLRAAVFVSSLQLSRTCVQSPDLQPPFETSRSSSVSSSWKRSLPSLSLPTLNDPRYPE
ncbi:hypothetical protein PIB30_023739 [Stylosanthes scabra]|uniref:Uncharacterized protein n=1 Tax=Stylosanthes scabra TaxID=79078 RepID=A0ABU6W7S7_9FABA|nr:hypothetical protein [Stylosanthes scabra]